MKLQALALISAGLSLLFAAAPAQAYDTFPGCESPGVHGVIINRFNQAEAQTWFDGVRIRYIDRTMERGVVAHGPAPILRRYCRGRALLEDGHYRTIHYLIEDPMGLAGVGWNVEFCLSGHDRWRVYDGYCRVLSR